MNPDFVAQLAALDAIYRFRIESPSFKEDEVTGKMRQISTGQTVCDIFDKTTGEMYVSAAGLTEFDALKAAIAKAKVTPKPLTPAQKQDAIVRRQIEDEAKLKIEAKDREIEDLKAQLEKLKPKAPEKPSRPAPSAG